MLEKKNSLAEHFLRWAQRSFVSEIATEFGRAATFDGLLSRLQLCALKSLPKSTQIILAEALPTGAGFTSAKGNEILKGLPIQQHDAVHLFRERAEQEWAKHFSEVSEMVLRRTKDLRAADRIRIEGLRIIRRMLGEWEQTSATLEPYALRSSEKQSWGEIAVHWSLDSPFELECRLFVYDRSGGALRQHDDYLGVLGIGPSLWALDTVGECEGKIRRAGDFLLWFTAQYGRIVRGVYAESG